MLISRGHSFRRVLADESGFTINELIVAMVVGSILVGYAFELYVFASRIISTWRAKAEVSAVADGVFGRMTLDLERSSDLVQEGDSVFVMLSDSREIVRYTVTKHKVLRSGVPMFAGEGYDVSVSAVRSGKSVDLDVRAKVEKGEVLRHGVAMLQESSTSRVTGTGGVKHGAR